MLCINGRKRVYLAPERGVYGVWLALRGGSGACVAGGR